MHSQPARKCSRGCEGPCCKQEPYLEAEAAVLCAHGGRPSSSHQPRTDYPDAGGGANSLSGCSYDCEGICQPSEYPNRNDPTHGYSADASLRGECAWHRETHVSNNGGGRNLKDLAAALPTLGRNTRAETECRRGIRRSQQPGAYGGPILFFGSGSLLGHATRDGAGGRTRTCPNRGGPIPCLNSPGRSEAIGQRSQRPKQSVNRSSQFAPAVDVGWSSSCICKQPSCVRHCTGYTRVARAGRDQICCPVPNSSSNRGRGRQDVSASSCQCGAKDSLGEGRGPVSSGCGRKSASRSRCESAGNGSCSLGCGRKGASRGRSDSAGNGSCSLGRAKPAKCANCCCCKQGQRNEYGGARSGCESHGSHPATQDRGRSAACGRNCTKSPDRCRNPRRCCSLRTWPRSFGCGPSPGHDAAPSMRCAPTCPSGPLAPNASPTAPLAFSTHQLRTAAGQRPNCDPQPRERERPASNTKQPPGKQKPKPKTMPRKPPDKRQQRPLSKQRS